MSSFLDPFRQDVRRFLDRHNMNENEFGEKALGQPDFCERLFDPAKTFQTRTLDKVTAFMDRQDANGASSNHAPKGTYAPYVVAKDETIGEYDYDRRFEIYKVMVDSAERGIDRRQVLNRFYFSVFVAIFVSISFVLQAENSAFPTRAVISAALFLAFLNSVLWLSTIFAARRLSASKYDAIGEMERNFEFAPFTREWEIHVEKKRNFPRFTLIELMLPSLLAIVCAILLIVIAIGWVSV